MSRLAATGGRLRSTTVAVSDGGWTAPTTWLVLLGLCVAVLLLDRLRDLPDRVGPGTATALAAVLAIGLSVRTGGRPWLPALLTIGYGTVATITLDQHLLAGGAVAVAALAATLALLATTPAPGFGRAAVEVIVAGVLATAGGLGVCALSPDLDTNRFAYVVLAIVLLGAFGLVYRLGAGLHGLGRRGYLVAAGALVLLGFALAYSEALGRWGTPTLISGTDDLRNVLRTHLHAVPHPIEALLGVPALCWGVFVRARRRQGWWVCAFGAALTAPATTRFIMPEVSATASVLGAVYSLVLGLAIGFVLIRVDQFFTGGRGRRSRRDEEALAIRPEPGRFAPLR